MLVDSERPHLVAHGQTQEIIPRKLAGLYDSMSKWEQTLFTLPRLRPDLPSLGAGTSDELGTSDHWGLRLIHIWTISDLKTPTLRILVLVLFRIGLMLVAIPAGVTFLQVTFLLAKHLLT
jgi:hypothetical protein